MIPSAHCPKGSDTRYVTAPLQAGIDGSPIAIAAVNQPATEVEKSRDIGATVSGFGNVTVKDNLTFEEYQRAVELLRQIEAGTHHVNTSDVLYTSGAFTTTNITYHNEVTSISSPGGNFHPLLVDVEEKFRIAPVDVNGVTQPIVPESTAKAGFVHLDGSGPTGTPNTAAAPTPAANIATLPDNNATRLVDAREAATNKDAIASNTGSGATRDMINKYATRSETGALVNGDKAVVSNDSVLFAAPSVGGAGPAVQATSGRDTPTLPREFTSSSFTFK